MSEYRRQHLVSRVLQSRFSDQTGATAKRVAQLRRASPASVELVGPKNNLKEDWFIEEGAGASRFEQIWGVAENAVVDAFAELDAHSGAESIAATTTERIADFMALHLVRSVTAKPLWDRSLARVVPRRRAAMLENGKLIDLARSTDIYPAEWTDEQIVDEITSHFEDPLRQGGEAFGETLVELYESVKQHFNRFHAEIAEADAGEFILPDIPCVPFDSATGRVGLLAGFGLNHADAIVMPLGPRHIASLVTKRPSTPWWRIGPEKIAPINDALARVALNAVYFRPDSGLEDVVRASWAAQATEAAR